MVERLSECLLGTHVTRCSHRSPRLGLLHPARRSPGVVGVVGVRGRPFGQSGIRQLGLPEPLEVNGFKQRPIEGVSMAYSFDDAKAKDRHTTQYFEIFSKVHLGLSWISPVR